LEGAEDSSFESSDLSSSDSSGYSQAVATKNEGTSSLAKEVSSPLLGPSMVESQKKKKGKRTLTQTERIMKFIVSDL
jgi:hypothetical protein